jgi:hypothetical protein
MLCFLLGVKKNAPCQQYITLFKGKKDAGTSSTKQVSYQFCRQVVLISLSCENTGEKKELSLM